MTRQRCELSVATLVLAVAFVFAALGGAGSGRAGGPKEGGTFKISLPEGVFDNADPALSYGQPLLDLTCAHLMSYPDKPVPEGLRLVPEAAVADPSVSRDGRTYTFTVRRGLRFSDGTPIDANAFAHGINRALSSAINPKGTPPVYLDDIVGATAVHSGKASEAAGVVARGNRLTVTLTKAAPDFPARTTMAPYCAVPPTLPVDPEGVGTHPGSGPYYLAEYVRGRRAVLERNRFYGGTRPHHVDRFVVDLKAGDVIDLVERGHADWGPALPLDFFAPARGLIRKYGVNRSQFWVKPGLVSIAYVLNVSRPLFRDNLGLRRAVNFAIDRAALVRGTFNRASDQYLPASMPGFKDAHIYPLDGPDLHKARALARGHTRSGKAVLWTIDEPQGISTAQVAKQNLKRIGLDVQIKALPLAALYRQATLPRAPFDLMTSGWIPAFIDPYDYMNSLFETRFIGTFNVGHFASRKYDALLQRAARLQGNARYRAYGDVDVQLARDAAPRAQIAFLSEPTLVSARVGCIVLRPQLDLAAVCLK
jgi:peptide/nickel transport system substrate-binding protein